MEKVEEKERIDRITGKPRRVPTLRVNGVSYVVRDGEEDKEIVSNARFHVFRGESVSITGASGSGKTTLLSLAGLLLQPTEGNVIVSNIMASSLTDNKRSIVRMDHMGFVFQQPQLIGSLTALEQLTYPQAMSGLKPDHHRAMELLDAVGIADQAHKKPHQLSGGQQQRVTIARAVMGNPDVILADEPTASLDSVSGEKVMRLLLKMSKDTSLVLVTHDQRAASMCDRGYTMTNGILTPAH